MHDQIPLTMRSLPRRRFIRAIAATIGLGLDGLTVTAASAADDRPLQIIVGYSAGGGTDVLARILSEPLSKVLGRPVIVRNLPGASGQIAASALLREGNDGAAILAINHPDLYMVVERNTAPLHASDFRVIVVDVQDPRVFLVKADSEFDTFAAFVTRAKAQPRTLAVSVTAGSAQELFAKWLFAKLGLDVTIVGYRGGAEAATALLASNVAANLGDDFARLNLRHSTRALFVGSQSKSPRWPEAPTLTSALAPYGVTPPSPNFLSRYGIYVVPSSFKAKDPAAYANLQQALLKARNSPAFLDYIAKNNLDDLSIGKPGEALDALFAADTAEIAKIDRR